MSVERMHPAAGRSIALIAALAATSVAMAACGDDEVRAPAAQPATKQSAAAEEPPRAFARRLAGLLTDTRRKKDCKELEAINRRSIYEFRCPVVRAVRRSMARFEIVGAAAHGTGAVVDYETLAARDGASMVLLLDRDGNWGVSRFGILADASVGSSDEASRAGSAKAVDRYLNAVRRRDCDEYAKIAVTTAVEQADICRDEFPDTEPLGRWLQANRDARPQYLGGNEAFGFYGLTLDRPQPRYVTVSTVKTVPGSLRPFLVLNVARGPLPEG